MKKFEDLVQRLLAAKENSDSWRTAVCHANGMMDGYSENQMIDLQIMVEVLEQRNGVKVGDKIRSFDFPHTNDYFSEGVVQKIEDGYIYCESFRVHQQVARIEII